MSTQGGSTQGGSKRKFGLLAALGPNPKRLNTMGPMVMAVRPRKQTIKSGKFEGVRNGVATAGSSGPEIKNLDVTVANTVVVSGTPYVNSITQTLAEGTGGAQRIGLKVNLKSVDLEANLQIMCNGTLGSVSATAPYYPVPIDLFVVWDKQPDGVQATAAQILASTSTNLTFGNIGYLDRFVVLRRERIVLDSSTSAVNYHTHIPLKLATRFADATAVPFTNDILVLAVSPNTAGAAINNAGLSYVARLKFSDA